jgi:flavin-dependent dehydrogenase
MERLTPDVVVIGAGPAGSAAARLLASWGHSVVVLGRAPHQPALAESLPPSCTKVFDQIGVRVSIDNAGFLRATGNTVRWGSSATRIEPFDAGVAGYQIERDRFDDLLATAAHAAGALVRTDLAARDATREGTTWRVAFDGGELRASWLLDCTGRSGFIARRGLRESASTGRTIAVAGVWQRDNAWPVDEPTHTLVESYDGGWAWSVPVRDGTRFVTVMLDPSVTELPGRSRLAESYAQELSRTTMISGLTRGARLIGQPWGCDASPYTARRAFDDGALLVGDASSFVDPLSSFGVKKALASAWLGAVAVHTALTDPAMTPTALELFGERERLMYDRLQRQSASLSLVAAGVHATEFWSGRSDALLDETSADLDVTTLRRDPRILAAFEELKRRDAVNLRTADAVRVVQRGTVRGHRIVLEEHLAAPAVPHGVRYCRNVDLVVINRLANQYDQVPDLYDAYNRATSPMPLPDFLGALSTMVGLGMLDFA